MIHRNTSTPVAEAQRRVAAFAGPGQRVFLFHWFVMVCRAFVRGSSGVCLILILEDFTLCYCAWVPHHSLDKPLTSWGIDLGLQWVTLYGLQVGLRA